MILAITHRGHLKTAPFPHRGRRPDTGLRPVPMQGRVAGMTRAGAPHTPRIRARGRADLGRPASEMRPSTLALSGRQYVDGSRQQRCLDRPAKCRCRTAQEDDPCTQDWACPQPLQQKERLMAMMPVLEDLDRCKIALQYVAERQSDSLTAVLEILLERLDNAIGEVH